MKQALFSVNVNDDIVSFAKELVKMNWHIIATNNVASELKRHNLTVQNVADFNGVKEDYGIPPTLHPKMETALTCDIDYKIDLVFDIPYKLDVGNDVGGRTLLSLGAKGNRIVISTNNDMRNVIDMLKKDSNYATIPESDRQELIDKINADIAEHYITLARRNGNSCYDGVMSKLNMVLLHGENPYQKQAELFVVDGDDPLSFRKMSQKNTNKPCFTNMADIDCIMTTLVMASEAFRLNCGKVPYIAVAAKHGNPCGMAVDWESAEAAVNNALSGNPLAIWGGELIVNFKIDEKLANIMFKSEKRGKQFGSAFWMLDVVVAPEIDEKGMQVLGKSEVRKLFTNNALYDPVTPLNNKHYRQVRGGFLRQSIPNYVLDVSKTELEGKQIEGNVLDSLIVAWSTVWTSNHGGNEIAIAKDRMLLAAGGGPSTVEAANVAVSRTRSSGQDTKNSVFAADAFFPHMDAPEVLYKAGCKIGTVPSGGKNEPLVREFFNKNCITVAYIPSQYRGFCRH